MKLYDKSDYSLEYFNSYLKKSNQLLKNYIDYYDLYEDNFNRKLNLKFYFSQTDLMIGNECEINLESLKEDFKSKSKYSEQYLIEFDEIEIDYYIALQDFYKKDYEKSLKQFESFDFK